MKLNQPMTIKGNKKSFYSYDGDEETIRESVDPLHKEMEDLITQEMKKTELPNDFSASVFNDKCPSHAAWLTGHKAVPPGKYGEACIK